MADVVLTSKCEFCKYGSIIEMSKARIKVYCSYKEKEFWYGCYVPCDNFTKQHITEEEE